MTRHRILLRTVVFDFDPDSHDAALEFWQTALDAEVRRGTQYPEYHVLEHPAALGQVMVQSLTRGSSRIHLDLETDDMQAEVDRLVAAGATIVQRHREWTVLEDPAGLLFCVVPAVSGDFDQVARIVEA